jgi:mannitol/fructose-specific phosphotransferase system IIA component (Ntr-type)
MHKTTTATSLAGLLKPETINLDLKEQKKSAALREVAVMLHANKSVANFDAFFGEILERERISNTALGHDIAIPHARTEQCTDILIAVGRSSGGIDFESKENGPVRLLFLIGTPKQMVTEYLRIVGNLARLLRRDEIRQQLLDAPDAAAFIRIIAESTAADAE